MTSDEGEKEINHPEYTARAIAMTLYHQQNSSEDDNSTGMNTVIGNFMTIIRVFKDYKL